MLIESLPCTCHILCFSPAGKVRNFKVKTKDGETLGAWHVLPDTVYGAAIKKFGVPETGALPDHVFDEALEYVHGSEVVS